MGTILWDKKRHTRGFTIVELVVVVAVIAILATITVASFGSWRTSINTKTVKSDLIAAATAMESARNQSTGYPTTLPSSFTPSENVVISPPIGVTPKTFCLDGSYALTPSIKYYTDETIKSGEPKSGTCATRIVASAPLPPTNITFSNTTSTQMEVNWLLASPNYATGYDVQCAQDAAFILQPVLVSVSGAATVSAVVSGIDSSTTYFCQVRATNANGKSDWNRSSSTGGTAAHTCAETSQYGTYPSCYDYDSLTVGTSVAGYWSTVPDGYLLEDGSTVSRTTYSDLFSIIGTTYGAGDGYATFKLPDSRGRVTVNINAADAEFNTVGELYGEKNHTLTIAEMPSHTHGQYVTANSGSGVRYDWSGDGASVAYSQGTNTSTVGGGAAYSVIQPSIVKRYAIKYRAPTGSTSQLPAGTTLQGYWGSVPTNYLYEDRAAVARTTYASLFSVIGTTYGAGDGSSTFNVPDSRGRVGVGLSAGDVNFGFLGQFSGEKQHTLTIPEMFTHSHAQNVTALSGGTGIRNDYLSDGNGSPYDQGQQTMSSGSGQPHNIIQPSITKRSTVKTMAPTGTQPDVGIQTGTSIEGWWSAAPAGFLLEDGSAVSRTTYADLFAVLGTTHGAGNGSTTFNLPDSRGRVGVNLSSDTEFNTIGKKFGSKTHIMTLAELPAHAHGQIVTVNSGGCCAIRYDYKSDSSGGIYSQGINTANTGGSVAFNTIQHSITKMVAIKF